MEEVVSQKKKYVLFAIIVGLVILLLAGAAYFLFAKQGLSAEGEYQAVFLSNGQVYFGQLEEMNDRYVEMNDIYYLQLKESLQGENGSSIEQPDLSLAKLGNELHGPEDKMYINRDHILFIENLKEDSKVVEAIKNHKNGLGL